jgi:folate-binding protein YgfZ
MIALPKPQLLEIAGADAVSFAHAQFCNDVAGLAKGSWQWNAWLSPQGRVRAFFHLLRDDDQHLRLLLRGGDAADLRTALTPYVLRAQVRLHAVAAVELIGFDNASDAGAGAIALPGTPARWLALRGTAEALAVSEESVARWRLADIRAGLPELAPALRDLLLPQWLGLPRLGAVSTSKGCYPGQEVMSRLHFKGGNKRSLYRLDLRVGALPAPGTPLQAAQGESAGQIIMAERSGPGRAEALASLLDAAADAPLRSADPETPEIAAIERFS